MALIGCKECGKEISDKAATCPNCGAPVGVAPRVESTPPQPAEPVKKQNRKTSPVAWAALIAIVGGLFWYSQSRDYKEQSLPALPVEVGYRNALTGPGLVLKVKSDAPLPIVVLVKVKNSTTQEEKSFRIDVPQKATVEIGHKEGWAFASGDQLELFNTAYQTWKGSIP